MPVGSSISQSPFDLTDPFLNFSGDLFIGAFGFQLWIIAYSPGDLLEPALYFVKLAFHLVLRAGFHGSLIPI